MNKLKHKTPKLPSFEEGDTLKSVYGDEVIFSGYTPSCKKITITHCNCPSKGIVLVDSEGETHCIFAAGPYCDHKHGTLLWRK